MPVARLASDGLSPNRFQFYATMDKIWTVGDGLELAQRGRDMIMWASHGTIKAIVLDRAVMSQSIPGLLMQPPLPPSAAR